MKRVMLLVLICLLFCYTAGASYASTTLRNGMEGEEVRRLQQALIDQGYLSGVADGKFGTNTENAVRKFQRKHKLTADGLAGVRTQELLFASGSDTAGTSRKQDPEPETAVSPASSVSSADIGTAASTHASSFFNGNYSTLRAGMSGQRVRILQQALIDLNFLSGSADGVFGSGTESAVKAFQRSRKLTADGLAGKNTLRALEQAFSGSSSDGSSSLSGSHDTPSPAAPSQTAVAPDSSSLRLLRWFDDVKPSLKSGQKLLVYDPSSSRSWTLRIYSCGRHCDAEPLTLEDTQQMFAAFGNQNTWTQKGVYVRLPDGRWTVASTHNTPHLSGSIKDNGFDGHLCVHFLRDMAECTKNDPNYGVSNQKTIRAMWKSLTGETID